MTVLTNPRRLAVLSGFMTLGLGGALVVSMTAGGATAYATAAPNDLLPTTAPSPVPTIDPSAGLPTPVDVPLLSSPSPSPTDSPAADTSSGTSTDTSGSSTASSDKSSNAGATSTVATSGSTTSG